MLSAAEEISKSPDSNAADAAKRITGITIVDNKYIYVRGLGERYSSVMLGNSTIPSPDPDKRVIPLDIFPVGLLDNIVIMKAYSPDMPGEFAGGIVQINPKDYPEEQIIKISIGTGYKIGTSFNDFYSYDGGKFDWFGVDDGTRAIPESLNDYIPSGDGSIKDDFKNELTPDEKTAYLPAKLSFEYGNSWKVGKTGKFGMILSGLFSEKYNNVDKTYTKYSQSGDSYTPSIDFSTKESSYSTSKGALLSLGYTQASNKLRWTSFYTHNSKDCVSVTEGLNNDSDYYDELRYLLQYVETSLLFTQLNGEHALKSLGNSVIDWTAVYSMSTRNEPDQRTSRYRRSYGTDDPYVMADLESMLTRTWSSHQDHLVNVAPSISIPFKQWNGLQSKVSFGAASNYRMRDSETRRFKFDTSDTDLSYPIEDYFASSSSIVTNEVTREDDEYNGELLIVAGYGLVDMPLYNKIRLHSGIRYEYSDMDITLFNPYYSTKTELPYEALKPHNVMPTMNLTWSPEKNTNVRLSCSKTVIRPDFRETTPFRYENITENQEWRGNAGLGEIDIVNTDLRWEWFPSASEIIAVSVFYKYLKDPIETVQMFGAGKSIYSSYNADHAHNTGVEIELKKNFAFVTKHLEGLVCSLNLAYIYSQVTSPETVRIYDSSGYDEYTVSETKRQMNGQAPYVINTGLSYKSKTIGFTGSVLYNITGPTIKASGSNYSSTLAYGNVVENPASRLDVVIKQSLWKGAEIKLTAKNLLNPTIKETQEYINPSTGTSEEKTIKTRKEGISFGFSYTQKF
jgi:hypothetical protein